MLLVITVASVLIMMGIRHYQFYQQQQQVRVLSSKIQTLRWALNRYFHQQGCNAAGEFSGNKAPSIFDDLLENENPDVRNSFRKDNWVDSYQVKVIGTGVKNSFKQPLYYLQVGVDLLDSLPSQQVQWLSQRLHADQPSLGRQLTWTVLPSTTLSEPGNSLWILEARREQFRQGEQQRSSSNLLTHAFSYCAH
jgi:hypothetical protein